jgi:hypothetical protein
VIEFVSLKHFPIDFVKLLLRISLNDILNELFFGQIHCAVHCHESIGKVFSVFLELFLGLYLGFYFIHSIVLILLFMYWRRAFLYRFFFFNLYLLRLWRFYSLINVGNFINFAIFQTFDQFLQFLYLVHGFVFSVLNNSFGAQAEVYLFLVIDQLCKQVLHLTELLIEVLIIRFYFIDIGLICLNDSSDHSSHEPDD